MNIRRYFLEIKHQFFPRWDRHNLWRISTRLRRTVHGYCDAERRVIEIVIQHADPDKSDCLLIHEICHAVAKGGHGKVWQRRLEKAARRADELGRDGLAKLLRQEIVNYQEFAEGREQAYQTIEDWMNDEPDLTLAQVKRSIACLHGLLVSEISTKLKRIEKVYWAAKRDAQEARALKEAWLKEPKC